MNEQPADQARRHAIMTEPASITTTMTKNVAPSRRQAPSRRGARGFLLKTAVLLLTVGGIGGGTWFYLRREKPHENASAVNDLYQVKITSFDMTIPASGELEALNSVEIRNQVESQTVIKWIIDEGARVKAGDILVELNSDQIKDSVEEETLQVESARSALIAAQEAVELQKSENASSENKAKSALDIATLEFDRWQQGEVVSKRKDLQVSLETAERNFERATNDLKNSDMLLKEGFISQSEYDQDWIEWKEAEANLAKSRLAIDVYEKFEYPKDFETKQTAKEEAEAELARTTQSNASQLAQKDADLINRQRQLTIREQRLRQEQQQFEACTLRAPGDGLVVYGTSVGMRWWDQQGALEIGQQVYNNQLLILLPDTRQMVASVKVHESQSSQIAPDQTATVKIDAMPHLQLPAVVKSVGVMAEQAGFGGQVREYTVKCEIQGENAWDLKPSMRCKADIMLGRMENVLAVPIQAVFMEKGEAHVWVPAGNGRFERRKVATGRNSETMIEIKEGLAEGDRVLLREPAPGEMA